LSERPVSGKRAVLVHSFSQDHGSDASELKELALAASLAPVAMLTGSLRSPNARFFLGTGKLEELRQTVERETAELAIFDHALTPSQQRNLEIALGIEVFDRTRLILEIFAQRAHSYEGKLQVELAKLTHLSTRLVRGWTHLERQKGGIGLRGGPGETQLELDKRLLDQKIRQVQKRLEKVEKQRNQSRNARKRARAPVVSLVGYTNAGKSTLFNALTKENAYAADQLFATLDPTLRQCYVSPGLSVVLADTVGFIRKLPHELIAAFRYTLQESCEADLLLHVIDASDDRHTEMKDEVDRILAEIGAGHVRQLQIYNKIDRIEDAHSRIEWNDRGDIERIWLSAKTGQGLALLGFALDIHFNGQMASRQREYAPYGPYLPTTGPAADFPAKVTKDPGLEAEVSENHSNLAV
jgi:GTP-binding protein HflX